MPDLPWRDVSVTPPCPICQQPLPAGRARRWCSPRCRQTAYRRRQALTPTIDVPTAASSIATGVYECPECGQRLAGERRCPECNLYARRIGTGGCCTGCGEILTIDELMEAATT